MIFDRPSRLICGVASAPSESLFASAPGRRTSAPWRFVSLRKTWPVFCVGSNAVVVVELGIGHLGDEVGLLEQLLDRLDADVGDVDLRIDVRLAPRGGSVAGAGM